MKRTTSFLSAVALAAATGLALGPAGTAAAPDKPVQLTRADLDKIVPADALAPLSPEQRDWLAMALSQQYCYCGCPHTLATCLRSHKSCRHAPRMARMAAKMAQAGLMASDITSALSAYYASFDKSKRAKLDTKDFGPPLGNPKAPITLVEFSDFGCPFCQMFRPQIEQFVAERKDRVKLFYKPFPLPGHEHSAASAEAVEWARDRGLGWQMHDLIFTHPRAQGTDDLVGYAKELGADGNDLRKSLETQRHKDRIEASKAEARAAGLRGTPTVFINGRLLDFNSDLSPAGLAFTLQDEEEWQKNGGGWDKD
jgi:protein-disulfide isomerase